MAIPFEDIAFDFVVPAAAPPASGKIDIEEARIRHLQYLATPPYVVHNGKIVHALVLKENDFQELINQPGIAGLKLYFCREESTNGNIALSIIVVGYDNNGENIIVDNKVFNNLDPCPDKCPGSANMDANSMNDLNIAKNGLGQKRWCKPNAPGGYSWFKVDNTPDPGFVWP